MIVSVGVPAIVFLLMFVVGLGLNREHLVGVLARPRPVLLGVLAQLLMVPLVAAALIVLFAPEPAVAVGILLVAAAPAGTISNWFVHVARGDVALSVAMTLVGLAMAPLTMPLITSVGLRVFPAAGAATSLPISTVLLQLLLFLILPLAAGLGVRTRLRHPDLTLTHWTRVSILALVCLIVAVAIDGWDAVRSLGPDMVGLALAFTAATYAGGWGVSRALGLTQLETVALAMEFSARNLALVVLVAGSVLGQIDFAVFGVVFFVSETPLLLLFAALTRRGGRPPDPELLDA